MAKDYFNRVSEGTLDSFLVRFRGVSRPSLPWCFGVAEGCFQHRRQYNGEKVGKIGKRLFLILAPEGSTTGKGSQNWQKAIFYRISKGTLDTFLVRFRGVSVLHCHGVFGVASVAEYWQKTIFNRVSEGTLDSFLVRFRGVSVLHCHGVLVWRRAVFSTGGSTTGKGWQNWQKTIFNIGTGGSTTGKGSQNWQKTIFNRISEGTLDTFLVRFRGVSVLHCHGVLVWRSIGKRLFLIGSQKGR